MPSRMLGRRPPHPESTHPRLKLARFAALPAPPLSVDWYSRIPDWPMFANNEIGDCVEAEMGHHEQVLTLYGYDLNLPVPEPAVIRAYEEITGYVPGDPSTDNGTNVQDAMSYWRKTGIANHKIDAFAQVNVANMVEVKTALARFGPLSIGFNFPASAMTQFDAGKPWDVLSRDGGIDGGHCVALVGYDATYLYVVTWGALQKMTYRFWAKYVDEAWTPLSREWINVAGFDPEGVDLHTLGDEFEQLTGEDNPFPVQPSPKPGPVPPVPVPSPVGGADQTLAVAARTWLSHHHVGANGAFAKQVQAWLTAKSLGQEPPRRQK